MPEGVPESYKELKMNTAERIKELEREIENLLLELSELKREKSDLQQKKDFAEKLVETAQVIVLVLNTEGRIVWFNPYMEELSGYKLQEVSGEDWFTTFISDSYQEHLRKLFLNSLRRDRAFDSFAPIITKDSREAEIEWNNKSLKDNEGKVVGLIAIGHDVTERNKAERALKESRELFSNAFRLGMEAISIIRLEDHTYIEVNEAFLHITGYDYYDVIGKTASEIDLWVDESNLDNMIEDLVKNNEIRDYELFFRRKDGMVRYLSLSGTVIEFLSEPCILFSGRDITELRQVVDALQRSEEKYRSIVEQSYEGIILTDEKGVIIEWNHGQERITGLAREDVLGKLVWDVQYQADPEKRQLPARYQQVRSMMVSLFKMETSPWLKRLAEHEIKRPDGSRRLIQSTIFPIHTDNELLVGAITRDITQQRHNEEELLFLSSITQQVSDAIMVTDTEYKITYVNQAVVDLYGYSEEELKGKDPIILNALPLAEEIQNDINRTVSSGKIWTGELINKRKDGSSLHIESRISPLYDKKDQIYAHVGIYRDVTLRKQAEDELRRERDKAQNYLDIARVIIVIIAADQRVTLINKTGCEVLGYKEKEIINKNWYDNFLSKSYIKSVKDVSIQLFAGDIPVIKYSENPVLTKSGEERMIAWHNTVLRDEEGRITHLLSSGEDITERRRVEDRIKASLREKEVLLKEIHHRVKNNLQIISSMLYLQSRYIKDKQTLNILKESQNRVKSMALIHEKLYQSSDLARIDFYGYIRSLAAHLLNSYGVDPNAVNLDINVEDVLFNLDTAIPCGLIFNELVSNSLKHAFPEDWELLKPGETRHKIIIDIHAENNTVTMTVSDNGIGFPVDQDFRNTESLGMRIVISLTEQLNGDIELDRTDGTAFKIRFSKPQ